MYHILGKNQIEFQFNIEFSKYDLYTDSTPNSPYFKRNTSFDQKKMLLVDVFLSYFQINNWN